MSERLRALYSAVVPAQRSFQSADQMSLQFTEDTETITLKEISVLANLVLYLWVKKMLVQV